MARMPDIIRQQAWRDFCEWAAGSAGMQKGFSAETGLSFDKESMAAFVDWITVERWGLDEAPDAFQADYAKRHP